MSGWAIVHLTLQKRRPGGRFRDFANPKIEGEARPVVGLWMVGLGVVWVAWPGWYGVCNAGACAGGRAVCNVSGAGRVGGPWWWWCGWWVVWWWWRETGCRGQWKYFVCMGLTRAGAVLYLGCQSGKRPIDRGPRCPGTFNNSAVVPSGISCARGLNLKEFENEKGNTGSEHW